MYELGTLSITRPLQRGVRRQLLCGSGKFTRYLDAPNYVPIELRELLGRHPQLGVYSAANGLDGVFTYEVCRDRELCDVARTAFLDVPVARDLDCVLLVRYRVEDRLLRKPW